MGDSEQKKKRSACSECHRLKKTCKFDGPQARTCARCLRLNKTCVPRVVIRRRRRESSGESKEEPFEELDCLECIRSAFQSGENSSFKALSWFPKAFRNLGLQSIPPILEWWVKHLFFTARKLQSFDRLYSSSALATTLGLRINSDWLHDSDLSYSDEETRGFEDFVHRKHWDPTVPMYFSKVNVGDRSLSLSPAFHLLFEDVESVVSRELDPKRNPVLDLWPRYLVNKEAVRTCFAEFTMEFVKTSKFSSEPEPHYFTDMLCSPVLHVVGRNQEPFTCRIRSSTYFSREGKLALFVIAFEKMEPQNPTAEAFLRECQTLIRDGLHDSNTTTESLPLIPDEPSSSNEEIQYICSTNNDIGLTREEDEQLFQNIGWVLTELGAEEVSLWEVPVTS